MKVVLLVFAQITKEDILAIKETVDLPVIGIVKRDYDHSDVFITATSKRS